MSGCLSSIDADIHSDIFLSLKALFLLQTAPKKSEVVRIYPMKPG